MDTAPILSLLQQRLATLMAAYAFGSRIKDAGPYANTESAIDLAVLVEGYADPVLLFELTGELNEKIYLDQASWNHETHGRFSHRGGARIPNAACCSKMA